MIELIRSGQPQPPKQGRITSEFRPLFDKEAYCDMVRKAKHYIKEGDIFQVVLSNRLEADFEGSLLDAYRVLRTTNPSPYMFYFSSDDIEMAGASPETLVKLEDGVLHTFPLAGTRKRGRTEQEDLAFEKELLDDEKERAEHNMLVDIGRNDIGKISVFGTVEVEKYMSIERFSHVMHIGSTVKGRIRPNLTALDAVDAVLPAGTLSGLRNSEPVRSLMSWRTTNAAFTAGPSVIWILLAIWIHVLQFVWHSIKTVKSLSDPVPASWRILCRRMNIRSVSIKRPQ